MANENESIPTDDVEAPKEQVEWPVSSTDPNGSIEDPKEQVDPPVTSTDPTEDVKAPKEQVESPTSGTELTEDIETPKEQVNSPVNKTERTDDLEAILPDDIEAPEAKDAEKLPSHSPTSATELGDSFEKDSNASVEALVEEGAPPESVASKQKRRARKNLIFAAFILLLLVGAVLGVLFGTGSVGGSSSGGGSPATSQADDSPATPPADDSPATPPADDNSPPSAPTPEDTGTDPTADPLLDILKTFSNSGLADSNSPQWRAYQWMANDDPLTNAETDTAKLKQRYALATLYAALANKMPSFATEEECDWPTVACGTQNATSFGAQDWQVTEINMARQSFTGTIAPEIELLSSSLVKLDMAENPELHGSIPEELYNLVNLKYLYLHQNAMTGSLSESFAKMQLLDEIYLGNNEFTGPIPYNLGSRQGFRPLRYLILHHNQMTGSIPEGMALRKAFFFDLSFNKFSGTLPADMGVDFVRLRNLYLDHNEFVGPIPESYAAIGDNQLWNLYLNDNALTGSVPTGWAKGNIFLDTLSVQNNQLTVGIDKEFCKISIYDSGEMVEIGADCEICSCNTLCDNCY